MGEIRSTLDIIMEKTKGMTLSDDEKKDLREKEITDKVRGFINKLIDNIITFERFEAELESFDEEDGDVVFKAIVKIVFPLIVPEEDNSLKIRILGVLRGIDLDIIRESLNDSEENLKIERFKMEKELMGRLKKMGVYGSGVIPNPKAYPEWIQKVSEIREELKERIHSSLIKQPQ